MMDKEEVLTAMLGDNQPRIKSRVRIIKNRDAAAQDIVAGKGVKISSIPGQRTD